MISIMLGTPSILIADQGQTTSKNVDEILGISKYLKIFFEISVIFVIFSKIFVILLGFFPFFFFDFCDVLRFFEIFEICGGFLRFCLWVSF